MSIKANEKLAQKSIAPSGDLINANNKETIEKKYALRGKASTDTEENCLQESADESGETDRNPKITAEAEEETMVRIETTEANTVADDDITDDDITDDIITDDDITDDIITDDDITDDIITDDDITDDIITDDAVTDDIITDDAVTDDASEEDSIDLNSEEAWSSWIRSEEVDSSDFSELLDLNEGGEFVKSSISKLNKHLQKEGLKVDDNSKHTTWTRVSIREETAPLELKNAAEEKWGGPFVLLARYPIRELKTAREVGRFTHPWGKSTIPATATVSREKGKIAYLVTEKEVESFALDSEKHEGN